MCKNFDTNDPAVAIRRYKEVCMGSTLKNKVSSSALARGEMSVRIARPVDSSAKENNFRLVKICTVFLMAQERANQARPGDGKPGTREPKGRP